MTEGSEGCVHGNSIYVSTWQDGIHPLSSSRTSLPAGSVPVTLNKSLVMALCLDRLMDVLSSTAAYAAVLVVFVGLTTTK
ncbi:hypothetical protein BDW75DRAFT_210891 [Aspergillus navahoensis]